MLKQRKLFTLFLILLVNFSLTRGQAALYGQCGGIGYAGSTVCASGAICYVQNPYYSQCLTNCPAGWQCQSKTYIDFFNSFVWIIIF